MRNRWHDMAQLCVTLLTSQTSGHGTTWHAILRGIAVTKFNW